MSTANKEMSRRFTELFNTGDEGDAREVLSPDIVFHGSTGDGELRGIEQMMAFVAGFRSAFPDARSTVEDQVAEGDKVATRWSAKGTHLGELGGIPPTGRAFAMDGQTLERFEGGKLAEVWVARDELGLLLQLGILKQPETARA